MIEEIKKIISEKVSGKIKAAHTEYGHFYILPNGSRVVSVTSKLIIEKPHLLAWSIEKGIEWLEKDNRWQKLGTSERSQYIKGAKLAHTEVRDDAGSVGHQAHAILEEYINLWIQKGFPIEDIRSLIKEGTDYRVYAVARSGETLLRSRSVIPIASELLVGSQKYNSAGTLDLLVFNTTTKKLELWDFKSSNQVSDLYALQVSAYKKFFEEMTGLKISKCFIDKLDKYTDKFKVYEVNKISSAFRAFKAISDVYDWLNNGDEKLIEDKVIVKL